MIIKCPNCDGALEYNAEQGLLFCRFCGSFHRAEDVGIPYSPAQSWGTTTQSTSQTMAQNAPQGTPQGMYQTAPRGMYQGTPQGMYQTAPQAMSQTAPQVKQPEFREYDSYEDMQEDALEARQSGKSGNFSYEYSRTDAASNRESYYEKQARLHEEFQNRPKMDYSKPFAGTSLNNLTDAERQKAIEEERIRFEQDKREIENLYQIDAMGKGGGIRGGAAGDDSTFAGAAAGAMYSAMVGRSVFDVATGVDPATAAHETTIAMAKNKNKEAIYDQKGHRILNKSNMYVTTEAPPEEGKYTLDNNIYTCTSCGAELSITGVETSSFCAYCGQPTIVFSRMEKTAMPDHIIPFNVTKDEALKSIRAKLQKGIFVPNEVKNFEVERLRGIYIPYWLYDAHFEDSMVIRTRVKSGKTTVTRYYRVNSDCNVYYYPVDASRRLNDNLSKKLEPYDYNGIRPFNPAYMSGFYADRFDMDADTMAMNSMFRVQQLVYEKAKKKVPGSPSGITDSYPVYHVKKQYYTLLPAWFMTFRYEGVPYTILVNGQNDKVVGAVPYSKKKFWGLLGGLFAGCSLVLVPICMKLIPALLVGGGKDSFKMFALIVIFIIGMYMVGWGNISRFNKSMDLSREETITKFVKERQDME